MKTSHAKNSTGSQHVSLLIRAADWARERGQVRPVSDVPAPEEQIGILFNTIRRREKFTLDKLANKSGFEIEELVAFEAGLLPGLRMCEMLPVLAKSVGFSHEELLQQLQKNVTKLFNQ